MVTRKLMLYSATVKPGSKKGPLVVESADAKELTVYLREKPVDGAANAALVKLLAAHFGVAKTCIIIKTGLGSRRKIIEVIK